MTKQSSYKIFAVYSGSDGGMSLESYQCLLLYFLIFCIPCSAASAGHVNIALLYPENHGVYAKVYNKIIHGINDHQNVTVKLFPVNDDTSPEIIELSIRENNIQAILILGQRSYQVLSKINTDVPVVIGAMVTPPNGYPAVSLAGDPELFFQRLNILAPQVNRVFVVYGNKYNNWLISIAKEAARRHNLELISYSADNIRDAVQHYRSVLERVHNETDAIWIPLDKVVPQKTILPMLLEAAWVKRLVIFSSNPSHVRKGALFALFPNHRLMGRELAELTTVTAQPDSTKSQIIPTRSLRLAVNQRTASHLGMHYTMKLQRSFDLIFPSGRK